MSNKTMLGDASGRGAVDGFRVTCPAMQHPYTEAEIDAVVKVMREACGQTQGKYMIEFEQAFCTFTGAKHAFAVNNCTSALKMAAIFCHIQPGDEVIIPAYTFCASAIPFGDLGAKIVWADINPDTWTIDPDDIARKITPKTKAVVCVHLLGMPCDMKKIVPIARAHGLKVVEDCAQAHDAEYCGQKVGTFGTMGFFSFYPTKNLGAFGDAGAILTDDAALRDKLRALRNYGSVKRYQNDYEGFNSRLDELQAGLLRVRLSHLDELTAQRRAIAQRYLTEIRNPRIELPVTAEGCTNVYHLFVVQTEERERFMSYLKENGVGCDVHYPTPPFLAKPYRHLGYTYANFPETERLYRRIVSIPIFNGMTEDEVDTVIRVVNAYE